MNNISFILHCFDLATLAGTVPYFHYCMYREGNYLVPKHFVADLNALNVKKKCDSWVPKCINYNFAQAKHSAIYAIENILFSVIIIVLMQF